MTTTVTNTYTVTIADAGSVHTSVYGAIPGPPNTDTPKRQAIRRPKRPAECHRPTGRIHGLRRCRNVDHHHHPAVGASPAVQAGRQDKALATVLRNRDRIGQVKREEGENFFQAFRTESLKEIFRRKDKPMNRWLIIAVRQTCGHADEAWYHECHAIDALAAIDHMREDLLRQAQPLTPEPTQSPLFAKENEAPK